MHHSRIHLILGQPTIVYNVLLIHLKCINLITQTREINAFKYPRKLFYVCLNAIQEHESAFS